MNFGSESFQDDFGEVWDAIFEIAYEYKFNHDHIYDR